MTADGTRLIRESTTWPPAPRALLAVLRVIASHLTRSMSTRRILPAHGSTRAYVVGFGGRQRRCFGRPPRYIQCGGAAACSTTMQWVILTMVRPWQSGAGKSTGAVSLV